MPDKLLGRQRRLESLEATTSWYLVVALLKELDKADKLLRNSRHVKKNFVNGYLAPTLYIKFYVDFQGESADLNSGFN